MKRCRYGFDDDEKSDGPSPDYTPLLLALAFILIGIMLKFS